MSDRGAVPENIEVEWQLDALDLRPVERWLAAFPRVIPGRTEGSNVVVTAASDPDLRTVDTYLDTEDWRVGRSGFVLRIRHVDGKDEVTLKDRAPAVAGLRRRLEVNEPLEAEGLEGLGPDGPVGRRLRALVGDTPLHPLLEVRTRRHPYRLHAANQVLGEIDLDDTIIVVGDDQYPVRMRRVEVEVESAWVDVLTPLVDQLRHDCGLQSAILSKFEVGLLAAGLRVPEQPDLGPTELPPDPSLGAVAYAVMRRNLSSMLAHEAGTRLGEDVEELHDMRVATRRLRAALALFEGVLPGQARRLRGEMGWLAGELGAVRDLDVQLERLDSWRDELPSDDRSALVDLAALLEREREGARENLLVALDSTRYERLVSEFSSLLRLDPGQGSGRQNKAARAPATAVVPGLIRARHRAAVSAARRARRTGVPSDFHRLRIRCKRLRYALEFVSEIYDNKTRPLVRRVVRLQDSLGLLQDSQVAVDRLHTLATASSELSPGAIFAMGGVAERYRREAERLIKTLPGHLEAMGGKPWRKLKALMEKRHREGGGAGDPSSVSSEPNDATVDDTGSRAGTDPSLLWPPSTPVRPTEAVADDDPYWGDSYAPALRSVPVEPPDADPHDVGARPAPVEPRAPEAPAADPAGGRRRKEPVFLPAPPPTPRPGQARPAPRAEPPPDDGGARSLYEGP